MKLLVDINTGKATIFDSSKPDDGKLIEFLELTDIELIEGE